MKRFMDSTLDGTKKAYTQWAGRSSLDFGGSVDTESEPTTDAFSTITFSISTPASGADCYRGLVSPLPRAANDYPVDAFRIFETTATERSSHRIEGFLGWQLLDALLASESEAWARTILTQGSYALSRKAVYSSPLEKSGPFEVLRDRIRGFALLPHGWNSYDAAPPTQRAIEAALTLATELQQRDVVPDWVVPTGDAGILMQFHHDHTCYKWEFDSDGETAVMVKALFDLPEFVDIEPGEMGTFIGARLHALH